MSMRRELQAVELKRRAPKQARARSKVDTIIEAATQILEKEGREALNTNRVAERAGVSISTLYQYFSDKNAILLELARRELELHRATVVDTVARAMRESKSEGDRAALRALIEASHVRRRSRRIAQDTLTAFGHSTELMKPVQDIEKFLTDRSDVLPQGGRVLSPLALFVLTRAVHGVIGALSREDVSAQSSAEIETELTRLVRGFVAPNNVV
jgi:AcrR family transcriptional regulator